MEGGASFVESSSLSDPSLRLEIANIHLYHGGGGGGGEAFIHADSSKPKLDTLVAFVAGLLGKSIVVGLP